jgi:hypothetical protein
LNDEEFNNVLNVVKQMPNITMEVNPEVLDDEDSRKITAKAIVTVTVSLKREPMEVIMQGAPLTPGPQKKKSGGGGDDDDEDGEGDAEKENKPKKPVWQKLKKKTKGPKKPAKNKVVAKPKNNVIKRTPGAGDNEDDSATPASSPGTEEAKQRRKEKAKYSGSEDSDSDVESVEETDPEDPELQNALDHDKAEKAAEAESDEDDETEWEKCQNKLAKKEKMKLLEGKLLVIDSGLHLIWYWGTTLHCTELKNEGGH